MRTIKKQVCHHITYGESVHYFEGLSDWLKVFDDVEKACSFETPMCESWKLRAKFCTFKLRNFEVRRSKFDNETDDTNQLNRWRKDLEIFLVCGPSFVE